MRIFSRIGLKEASAEVKIRNRLGMHARAAGRFRNLAGQYKAQIKVIRGKVEADAKSILGLMALGASKDTVLIIRAYGEDAEEAVKALVLLVENYFGEEE